MEIIGIQGFTNFSHTAIHHIGRCHDVGTAFSLGQGYFSQKFQGGVVIHFMTFELTAVAAVCVLAEADIPNDNQVRHRFLNGADGTLHRACHIPGRGANVVLVFRKAEYFHCRNAQLVNFFRHFHRIIHRKVVLSRHAGDFFLHVGAGNDENRVDEIIQFQGVFPDHGANGFRFSQSSWTKCV